MALIFYKTKSMVKLLPVTLILLVLLSMLNGGLSSGCRNEQGDEVDWFVAIRLPDSRRYWYFENRATRFRVLPDETFLRRLFEGIDLRSDSVQLWNDEPAQTTSPLLGAVMTAHDKGVLYQKSGSTGGFYLLHSVPAFPSHNGVSLNFVTPTGSNYGQSMICISLKAKIQYDMLMEHINAQNSRIYFNSFASELYNREGKRISESSSKTSSTTSLKKLEVTSEVLDQILPQTAFRFITKTKYNLDDPYEGVLAGAIKSNWITETWGRPYKANTCDEPGRQIVNNQQICFGSTCYASTKDHSKWALSTSISNLVCISGLNHMDSQSKRGGTFVCFTNMNLYLSMRPIASQYIACK